MNVIEIGDTVSYITAINQRTHHGRVVNIAHGQVYIKIMDGVDGAVGCGYTRVPIGEVTRE